MEKLSEYQLSVQCDSALPLLFHSRFRHCRIITAGLSLLGNAELEEALISRDASMLRFLAYKTRAPSLT